MSRYIDADHLIKRAKNPYGDSWASTGESTSDFVDYINEEPTVEVKPIVYGEWVEEKIELTISFNREVNLCVCSNCKERYSYDKETLISMTNYNFCPNCGATMRKESEGEE